MPLPPEVLRNVRAKIAEAEKGHAALIEHLAEAKLAGIDVSEQQKQADELAKQIRQMKMLYGS
jgi:hypothetical protein